MEEIASEEPNFSTMSRTRTTSSFDLVDAIREKKKKNGYASASQSCVTEKEPNVNKGNNNNNNISSHEMINFSDTAQCYYCYSLLEAIPIPGPTWSTTAPCVLAEPPSLAPLPFEASLEELGWGENQASSYTWWLGFLESLDDNRSNSEKFDDPFVNNVELEEEHLESSSIDLSCCPDDWLMIPTVEKDVGDL